jgi:hypothetical protein
MPLSPLSSPARKKINVQYLQEQVEEDETVFLRAYFETSIENENKQNWKKRRKKDGKNVK